MSSVRRVQSMLFVAGLGLAAFGCGGGEVDLEGQLDPPVTLDATATTGVDTEGAVERPAGAEESTSSSVASTAATSSTSSTAGDDSTSSSDTSATGPATNDDGVATTTTVAESSTEPTTGDTTSTADGSSTEPTNDETTSTAGASSTSTEQETSTTSTSADENAATASATTVDQAEDGEPSTTTTSAAPATTAPPSTSSTSTTAAPSTTEAPATITSTTVAPTTTTTTAAPDDDADGATAISLVEVARLSFPTDLTTRAGTSGMYVTEKRGRIIHLGDDGTTTPIADYRDRVRSGGNEQGLLGIAFSPDGSLVYLNYTDQSGATVIEERPMNGDTPGAPKVLLLIDQPYGNHNGGDLDFGPDGYLYIGMGDGGSANDPLNAGQDLSSLLGAILRIDPLGGEPYAIPSDNPHVGDPSARDEIWISGARNPWRLSFDRANGDLWIADVGQNTWEEINRLAAPGRGRGANLGWRSIEGPIPANPLIAGTVAPIHVYNRADGCSISGGVVARGSGIAALEGAYLFADFCEGWIRALYPTGTNTAEVVDLGLTVRGPVGFGTDTNGQVHVLSADGPIYRITATG